MDVITLESDEEDSQRSHVDSHQSNGISSTGISATAIIHEKPLDLEALFNQSTTQVNAPPLSSNGGNGLHHATGYVNHYHPNNHHQLKRPADGNSLKSVPSAVLHNGVSHVVIPRNPVRGSDPSIPTALQNKRSRMAYEDPLQPRQMNPIPYQIPKGNVVNMASQLSNNNIYRDVNTLRSKLAQFATTYIEATDPKQIPADDEFAGQFKCTYNGCNKRLSNNVVFMYHMWAHINRFKTVIEEDVTNLHLANNNSRPEVGNIEQKDDVARLRTCPECLIVQPSPNRMLRHLHYHRVHKRTAPHLDSSGLTICAICEVVMRCALESVLPHFQRHGQDTPYLCKKPSCKYRCSSREALLQHFTEHHCGTSMVLCPFCLASFNITYGDRQRKSVLMKQFVQHMVDHELYQQHTCNQCAIRLVRTDLASMQQKIQNHNKASHTKPDQKWKIDRKKLVSLRRLPSKVICWPVEYPKVCIECRHVICSSGGKQLDRHFKEMKRCLQCDYETACPVSMELHDALSTCQNGKSARWPFGQSKLGHQEIMPTAAVCQVLQVLTSNRDTSVKLANLQCSNCLFGSDADKMAEHLAENSKCVGATATIFNGENLHQHDQPSLRNEEEFELENLGFARLRNLQNMPEHVDEVDTIEKRSASRPVDEALGAILPLARVTHAKNDDIVVKYLTCEPMPDSDDNLHSDLLELLCSLKSLVVTDDVGGLCEYFRCEIKEEMRD